MTTNKEWLFSLPLEEQIAWMESEHYEPNPDCSAMLYRMFTENMKHEPCSDYEPKNDVDSRELLEADVREWIDIATYKKFTPERMLEVMLHWLDRQAAITDREWEAEQSYLNAGYKEQIAELKGQVFTLKCECEDLENELHNLTAERDELQAQADEKWNLYVAEHRRADSNAADREMYREATSALVDSITDGLRKVNSILDGKDEGLA